jgi:hypothetical protein
MTLKLARGDTRGNSLPGSVVRIECSKLYLAMEAHFTAETILDVARGGYSRTSNILCENRCIRLNSLPSLFLTS